MTTTDTPDQHTLDIRDMIARPLGGLVPSDGFCEGPGACEQRAAVEIVCTVADPRTGAETELMRPLCHYHAASALGWLNLFHVPFVARRIA